MTKLDTSVVDIPLLMVLDRKKEVKETPLAQGYHYQSYDDSFYEPWCQLQTEVGLFPDLESAHEKLNLFLKDGDDFARQFLFIVDQNDELVASCGLWKGLHFDEKHLRVHYVAVSERAQHKGIARAMLSKLCVMYQNSDYPYDLYLATQTGSYAAIFVYEKLGFEPYLGSYQSHSEEEVRENWKIAQEILNQKKA